MTAKQIRHARDLLTRPDNTAAAIASLPGVSHAITWKYILEVTPKIPCPLPPKSQTRLYGRGRK